MPADEELHSKQQTCLGLFVLRARRVEAHSLAADPQQVVQWAMHTMDLERTADGQAWLVQHLPPEELLESAAARVRPLILQNDPIYHGKVLNAISYLVGPQHRSSAKPHLDQLRTMWKRINPNSGEIRAYTVQVTRTQTDAVAQTQTNETSDPLTADQLAFAWIYGDTIHADAARQAEGKPFGINERYRAASGIVAELIMNTVATLNLVRALQADGRLTLPDEVFELAVIVEKPEFRQPAEVYLGTSQAAVPPKPGDPPGPDWQPVPQASTAEEGDKP